MQVIGCGGRVRVPEIFSWEDGPLRLNLPDSLLRFSSSCARTLVVPKSVVGKIEVRHPTDVAMVRRLGELFRGWEYAGLSPKGNQRLEVYRQFDGKWYVAVIQMGCRDLGVNVLVTFHQVYARKVRSRVCGGNLKSRQ